MASGLDLNYFLTFGNLTIGRERMMMILKRMMTTKTKKMMTMKVMR